MFYGKKPTIAHLRGFGSRAYIHIPIEDRKPGNKFEARAINAIFVGYGDKVGWYRFWTGKKIVISRDCEFLLEDSEAIMIQPMNKNKTETNNTEKIKEDSSTCFPLRRSNRTHVKPSRYGEDFCKFALDEPMSYTEAMTGLDSEKWNEAIKEEFESMEKNSVWEIVEKPLEGRIVGCKWIFKTKLTSTGKIFKYKARLVAQGFTQVSGIDFDETYSPVVRYETIRILIAHALHHNMVARQFDIKTAFLNGDLDFKVYMKIPEGMNVPPGRVCCFKRSIYGLKQSSRQWNQKLFTTLQEIDLKQSFTDPCFHRRNG